MTGVIDIAESCQDKESWFSVKRFRIGNTRFERPLKTLDARGLTESAHTGGAARGLAVAETSKEIGGESAISAIQDEHDDGRINRFFNRKRWLGLPTVVNLTLAFNPCAGGRGGADRWCALFDMYCQYSSLFLTVPNIRMPKTSYPDGGARPSLGDYIGFVDSAFDILDTRNGKPIFVPVSLKMSYSDLSLLMKHYIDRDRLCLWFDFEGKAVSETTMGRIAHAHRRILDSGNMGRSVAYFTNIRREIVSNPAAGQSPASDVLASVAGASIIGSNREPRRPPPPSSPPSPSPAAGSAQAAGASSSLAPAPPEEAPASHKARLLDRGSYYYTRTRDPRYAGKRPNVARNAALLDAEFSAQSEAFMSDGSILPAMRKKEMLARYRDGAILRALTRGRADERIDDYL